MSNLTDYEKSILKEIEKEIKFPEKILLNLFKRYTYKIYQKGFRDKYFSK